MNAMPTSSAISDQGRIFARAPRPMTQEGEGDFVEVPLLGKVAAGQPLLAVEKVEDTVKVDRFFVGQTREVFALRVKGDSMIEDGILNGDFVFVKKQLQAQPGEIVVAMIGDEATVKRYYPEGDKIRFQLANAAMKPIYVRKRDFRSLWIQRINAAARTLGISYSKLIGQLNAGNVQLNRKMLAEIAISDPVAFERIVKA